MSETHNPHDRSCANPPPDLPPLRLYHILTWVAITAGWLAPAAAAQPAIDEVSSWWIVLSLPYTFGATLAVTCCGFGLWWRWHKLPFPTAPSQWLLAALSALIAVTIVYEIVLTLCLRIDEAGTIHFFRPEWFSQWFHKFGLHVSAIPVSVLNLWLAWRFACTRRWMIFFILNAIATMRLAVWWCLFWTMIPLVWQIEWVGPALATGLRLVFSDLAHLLPAIALILATYLDQHDGVQRHWSHWCGVAAWFTVFPTEIALALINQGWISYPWTV